MSLAERSVIASPSLPPGGDGLRASPGAVPGVPDARRGGIDAVLPTRHAGTRKLRIAYEPDRLCVESKSLKLYLWSYRDEGAFHEAVTTQILDDLVAATKPQWMRIEGDFLIRGGIRTLVVAEHGQRK